MKIIQSFVRLAVLLLPVAVICSTLDAKPFEAGKFKGRIAYTADGNHNDPDDWIASPMALAIFAEAGVKDRLVHFDYNNILTQTNPEWEKLHAASVLGAADQYGFDRSRFFDCRRDLAAAEADLVKAINASSAEDPLYLVIAGPMEVPAKAIAQADPAKRKYIYCISHSRWNDGFAPKYPFACNKRSVIDQDVHWVQIRDQNQLLSFGQYGHPAAPAEFAPYFWMRDSTDPKVHFLWDRMVVSTRPDPSDAGMAWFLVTGEETCDPKKLERLLAGHQVPPPILERSHIRLEAENFRNLDGYALEDRSDRGASQRLETKLTGGNPGKIRTLCDEPFMPARGIYDVEIRYCDEKDVRSRFTFLINGVVIGSPWESAGSGAGWTSQVIRDVTLNVGDEIRVDGENGSARLDYVQLNVRDNGTSSTVQLDDPAAMPGGLIVAGGRPGYLKYNGGGAVFLTGPDNPEEFLYRGTLNPDGTRSGGNQSQIIADMSKLGINAFHCLIFRMQRCNIKREGDDAHCPFVNHDPSQPLNEAVLNQWEGWLTEFERAGINLDFEFYNDATDVEMMGWKLDSRGNLHPDEYRLIAGIVQRFKHHKNILWSIEESCNKLPRERIPHFKKIAAVIAGLDNFHHPIVQSFVTPEDPEGDFPKNGVMSSEYIGDPNIRVVTWLHVIPHGTDYEKQHQEYLRFAKLEQGHFIAMKNETFHHPRTGEKSRRYMWSSAMAGQHTMEAYHHADDRTQDDSMREDGFIRQFMEQTDFYKMVSQDELAAGATKWVLAQPNESYIAYTYDYTGPMGLKNIPRGTYDLLWFDTETGRQVSQPGIVVEKDDKVTWARPQVIGDEIALYIKRVPAAATR